MKNIPLSVLDAYAQRLTSKQAHMLYENKMQKPYKKALYENNSGKQLYKLYLDDYTIAEEVEMNKIEFLTVPSITQPSAIRLLFTLLPIAYFAARRTTPS